jgi:hypothetical protein
MSASDEIRHRALVAASPACGGTLAVPALLAVVADQEGRDAPAQPVVGLAAQVITQLRDGFVPSFRAGVFGDGLPFTAIRARYFR